MKGCHSYTGNFPQIKTRLEKQESRAKKQTKAERAGHALDGVLCCKDFSIGG